MNKAIKAFAVGDKLYNMERIHSKLIHFSKQRDAFNHGLGDNYNLSEILEHLKQLVMCFSKNLSNGEANSYLESIMQTKRLIGNFEEVGQKEIFQSFCYMHGRFIRFRGFVKNTLKRGCEINYQDVCLPILKIELARKEKRNNKL